MTRTSATQVTTDDGVVLAVAVTEPATGVDHAPALLLVHGFGGAKEDFADHVEALAREQRVVVFDHRGHGDSEGPPDPASYSLDRLAADTLAVADAFALDTFRLLGHSMGGMVAQRVVLDCPERVHALVLMDTSAGPPPGIDPEMVRLAADVAMSEGMDVLRRLLDEQNPLGSPAHERVLAERPGFQEYGDRKWASLAPAMWAALATEMTSRRDDLAALAAVTAPTLVLVGEQDETFIETSFRLADTVPDARLVVVPDAGHSPQFENPTVWFATLDGFLEELG